MNINARIWENSIADLPPGDLQAERFTHYAREFFIPDNIAPAIYLANVAVLMSQKEQESESQPSPSAVRLSLSGQRPQGIPTWFLAGYPDVVVWFEEQAGPDRTSVDSELAKRAMTSGTPKSRLVDEDGFFAHTVLRTLVEMYREHSDQPLECAATPEDLQEEGAGNADDQEMTARQAIDLIATNISHYERELAARYGDRFPDLRSRLVAAGLLQLGYYVLVDHAMPLTVVTRAADESMACDDPVVEFVERVETEIFCVEGGNGERQRVTDACRLLRSRNLDMVTLARTAYEETPTVTQAVTNLMEAPELEGLRQVVGITPVPRR